MSVDEAHCAVRDCECQGLWMPIVAFWPPKMFIHIREPIEVTLPDLLHCDPHKAETTVETFRFVYDDMLGQTLVRIDFARTTVRWVAADSEERLTMLAMMRKGEN